MAFNSLEYAVFFLVVFAVYWRLPHRAQNLFLLAASWFFYACWDWRFLSLMLASTTVAYWIGLQLEATSEPVVRKRLVTISVVVNLGILAFFKYFGFFSESLQILLTSMGASTGWLLPNIVLPIGISFYTFQALGYTIDIYRREVEPSRHFLDFALFKSFFPQLIAGPIERAHNLLPRILSPRVFSYADLGRGSFLILVGLFKKVVVADGLAPSVDGIFRAGANASGGDVWLGSLLFALQIYGDFSGYTDIARGSSKLLGIDLMQNFRSPYFSSSPQEFWTRWHISLSSWLRDYLYISLGGNRGGQLATYRNLMLTMVLGGLWHGAAWNYVLWGAYQGLLLVLHRALSSWRRASAAPFLTPIKILGFFVLTCYGWVLFRARSLAQCVDFTLAQLSAPLTFHIGFDRPPLPTLAALPVLIVMDWLQYTNGDIFFYRSWSPPKRGLLYALITWLLVMGLSNAPSEFVYFQF